MLIESVVDEAVNEDMDDKLGRVATTASRRQDTMGDAVAQTRSERVSKISNDPLLVGFNTPRSGEDRWKLNELMDLCTNLQNKVLDLETIKTTQAQQIDSLKRRVKKLEKKQRLRAHKLKRLYKVGWSARVESSNDKGEEVVVEQEVVIDKEPINDAAQRNCYKGHEEASESRTTTTISSKKSQDKGKAKIIEEPMKLKKKDQIWFDEEVARKLQEEIYEEERLVVERARQEEEASTTLIETWNDIQAKKLVKDKYGSSRPEEDYDRVLWGDLKFMFNPHVEDEV
nr:hypothetical protein [Tanacetum cinerariifolium]